MAELILNIINNGLPILDKLVPTEATKIRNLILNYGRDFDAEMAKGDKRDDARLDMLERELCNIGGLFSAALKSASP